MESPQFLKDESAQEDMSYHDMWDAQSSRVSLHTKANSLLDPPPRNGMIQTSRNPGVVHNSRKRPWKLLGCA